MAWSGKILAYAELVLHLTGKVHKGTFGAHRCRFRGAHIIWGLVTDNVEGLLYENQSDYWRTKCVSVRRKCSGDCIGGRLATI